MNPGPWMERADVKAFLMQDLDGPESAAFDPIADTLVDAIFVARGNPKRIITPMALSLAHKALTELETAIG